MSGGSMIFGHVNSVEPGLTGLLFISEIVPEDIFRLKKFLLLFVFTVSFPLRSIDRVCFNNLPVERWSNCIFTRLPPSLTWLIVSRNSSDCWTIEILWSGKCVETKRIELVFKFLLLIGKSQFLHRNPFVFGQLVLSVYPRAWHDYSS